jgi:hypothetical protein
MKRSGHRDAQVAVPITAAVVAMGTTQQDAKLCLDFAMALAEFLFVLPARVTRGITETKKG